MRYNIITTRIPISNLHPNVNSSTKQSSNGLNMEINPHRVNTLPVYLQACDNMYDLLSQKRDTHFFITVTPFSTNNRLSCRLLLSH